VWGKGFVVGVAVGASVLVAAALGQALSTSPQETEVLTPQAAPKQEAIPAATARKQMAIPVRISIRAIGVNARVIRLGLNRDRTIQVPTNFADTGWFQPGPEPGEVGAAVVVGHLASRSGPSVFWRLSRLKRGDKISIRLADGSTVRFVATSMLRVPKNRFPTKLVYAKTRQPTLRLITCAGALNTATGHHPDNYIVFASLDR
jgi:sortase (surface protein transpeptidase)